MTTSTSDILKERGSSYGDYSENAVMAARMRAAIQHRMRDNTMNPLQDYEEDALYMIVHKMCRVVGSAVGEHYATDRMDTWQDIAGYAELVVRELKRDATIPSDTNEVPF